MTLNLLEEHQCFGGVQQVYAHQSQVTKCIMKFGLFLPPQVQQQKLPVLYWLSGLGCTEQNFINKSGAQRIASELGLVLVVPDTSPRNIELPGDREHFDFGLGAGFYLDALQKPWSDYYQMAIYVRDELPKILGKKNLFQELARGILGHSMGGHGALTLALKNPQNYSSVSALAPICAPSQSPWGQKAFSRYLGKDNELWFEYDACELIKKKGWPYQSILIDQGTNDPFLQEQLKPELFQKACKQAQVPLNLRMQEGYDHSYYFIATFIEDHLRFHAKLLYDSKD